MNDVVVTAALTGILTDPRQHPVPVTPDETAREARRAVDAGASIVHLHFRDQRPERGHLPTWDPEVAAAIVAAVREECPGVLVNQSTGVLGSDVSGPVACLERLRPEIAACNAGTLNYLKLREDGSWAWPPIVFDNPVEKVAGMLEAIVAVGAVPEMECFDVGIVRSVELYRRAGMLCRPAVNLVMGVASGMPADPNLLDWLVGRLPDDCRSWQVTAIGREEIWGLHRRAAELGGSLRTGLEDTFARADGSRARSNGELMEDLVGLARAAGREPASPEVVLQRLGPVSVPGRRDAGAG